MSGQISMRYDIEKYDIDSVLETASKLKSAKDEITSHYPTIDCRINLGIVGRGSLMGFNVNMKEEGAINLEPALNEYFSLAGTPSFVHSKSDYGLVERTLRLYHRKLKRKLDGGGIVKHVVDRPVAL